MIREIKLLDLIHQFFAVFCSIDSRSSKDIIELTTPIFRLRLFALFFSNIKAKFSFPFENVFPEY